MPGEGHADRQQRVEKILDHTQRRFDQLWIVEKTQRPMVPARNEFDPVTGIKATTERRRIIRLK